MERSASQHDQMLLAIEKLLVIQDRDRKIRVLKQELKHAPAERKKLEEKSAGMHKHLDEVKLKSKELEVERKKLENEAQSKRDQIAKYQVQKFQTRKNEEFQAMTTAIEHLQRDIRAIEDRELELMEQAEELKPRIVEAEKADKQTKAAVDQQIADLAAKVETIEKQVKSLETERSELVTGIDEDLLDTYQRLLANKGEAVVAVEHEVCTGCHVRVTASTNAAARAGRAVVHCDQCGRIIYYNDV